MFLVVRGTLRILVNDWGHRRELVVKPGEFVIIPRTMDHLPIADEEVHVMLFEPQTTLNTGNAGGERTIRNLPRL
jgi:mannose-6-phosphate isomerase-like protein (cupin superfamily)